MGRPAALAPEPGAAQLIGEVSAPAEGLGVRARACASGRRSRAAPSWCWSRPTPSAPSAPGSRRCAASSPAIGAEVESERPGEAFFEAGGLRRLWGGTDGVLERSRREAGMPLHLAAAPVRFCSYAAARRADPRERPPIVPDGAARRFLAPLPVALLHGRLSHAGRAGAEEPGAQDLPNELERLGIETLGRLAGLPRDAVADRFGGLGLRALKLARGGDRALRPREALSGDSGRARASRRRVGPTARARDGAAGREAARPPRAPRADDARAAHLGAARRPEGGWRRRVTLRSAGSERGRLATVLIPLLALLPGPAASLRLEAVSLGPATGEQMALSGPEEQRRRKIAEAVRQARAAGGSEAVLRVLEVDPSSRVPERREVLMPFPEEPSA